jgi:hypothetical protein
MHCSQQFSYLVQCERLDRWLHRYYDSDYAPRSKHGRKELWYGLDHRFDPMDQDIHLDRDQCNQICLMYLRRVHIHYPFITLQGLDEMKQSWLSNGNSRTGSDVIFLLIIALGAIVGRNEPLPTPTVEPIERWSETETIKAIQENVAAIPGLKYFTYALALYNRLADIKLLQRVQVHLLLALYADQIMLLSAKHRHIHEACKRCISLLEEWSPG